MAKHLPKKIKQLRGECGLSQAQVARELKLSRPTYAQVEKGFRAPTVPELETLASLFGVPVTSFWEERLPSPVTVTLANEKPLKELRQETRISVPQSKVDIFKEVLLYVLAKVGAKPSVGETVLYKLLYFIDFDFYEKYEEQLIGATYIRNRYGPTPLEFQKIVEDMETRGEIVRVRSKYFQYPQRKYLPGPSREPDLSKLDAREIKHVDEVLARLSDMTARELTNLSHKDVPWISAERGGRLDYESVFYRTTDTSVRKYDEED
ncbi:MAG: DUF4065 domain-containing protein [Proteobacteria bacterium]|nr:DUF4065 domain-containing protein [Pseudomonadota bacterium]